MRELLREEDLHITAPGLGRRHQGTAGVWCLKMGGFVGALSEQLWWLGVQEGAGYLSEGLAVLGCSKWICGFLCDSLQYQIQSQNISNGRDP